MKERVKKFRCWSNSTRVYDLEFIDDIINIQIKVSHKFKLFQILNEDREEVFSELYTSIGHNCKLSIYTPGLYYLYLYVSDDGQNFVSFIGGKQIILYLDKTNQWYFKIPEYTMWNRRLIE